MISHFLLQTADLVWEAGLTTLASELVSLAHSACDRMPQVSAAG